MKTIWKFQMGVADTMLVTMPAGARVIHVGREIPGVITLWAEVDLLGKPSEERAFHAVGTGNPIGDVGQFLGTVMDPPFVWHIYEATD